MNELPNWDFGSYGFTGTRRGMTRTQAKAWSLFMLANGDTIEQFHHGCAVGADSEANDLMMGMLPHVLRVGHPSNLISQRNIGIQVHEMEEAKDPLTRNLDIIKACQVLTACPGEEQEVLRSGTWSTIRRAMKDRLVIIFYPSGRVEMNKEFAQDQRKKLI